MKLGRNAVCCWGVVLMFCCSLNAQLQAPPPEAVVPQLVNFSGKATDAKGNVISDIAGMTFSIYNQQEGGAPLWMETQNVTADAKGNYTVQLGASKSEGLPLDLFSSGEARWLGVRINNGEEQPRVLLLSVPYALKAADAQTLGGLPASAFVLAAPPSGGSTSARTSLSATSGGTGTVQPDLAGSGTADHVPLWTPNGNTLGNSVLYQKGTGSTARIGINTTSPATTLDVKGTATVRGAFTLPATGAATATAGKNSQPQELAASVFNSGTSTPVTQTFQWQAEPVGNNTASASGSLNLLFGQGTATPTETGLNIARNGQITFAPGQTFPGAGTVTSVGLSAPSAEFAVSGSPVTTSGSLGLKWKVAPTSANSANAIVKRDATGSFDAGAIVASLGLTGLSTGSGTAGVNGTDSLGGYGVLGVANGTSGQGVWGESFGTQFAANGQGADGVHGQAHSSAGSGVAGLNSDPAGIGTYGQGGRYGVYGVATKTGTGPATGAGVYGSSVAGPGVYGTAPEGFGFATDSNVSQARTAGGWVKAMVLASGNSGKIVSCFNSTLKGAAATTSPCGFGMQKVATGDYIVNFGFEADDRFFSLTGNLTTVYFTVCTAYIGGCNNVVAPDPNDVEVTSWCYSPWSYGYCDTKFYLIVY